LLAVFEYLERERGISRAVLIEAVQSSLLSAARKSAGAVKNLSIEIDKETGAVKAFCDMTVVAEVTSHEEEITLDEALKINPEAKLGDTIRKQTVAKDFGRIAAQTAKQVIIQRIREAEHKIIFNEYKDRVGELLTAVVRRYERGNVILDLGKAEAILPPSEQCAREGYGMGRRFKVYVVEVKDTAKGPEIIVSRSHPELVRKLFELEVPEIGEATVQIKAIARDPGFRTKIAVGSTTEKVDPVGACVGMRGARVKDVVRELNGERVDIVRWNEDPVVYITNALSPAKPREIKIVGEKKAEIIVDDDQFALAMGKKGQGIRLVSDLTGWGVDIKRVSDRDREGKEAGTPLGELKGLGKKVLTALTDAGYKNLGDLRKATVDDLVKLPGIGDKTAQKIVKAAAEFRVGGGKVAAPEAHAAGGKTEPAAQAGPSGEMGAAPVKEAAAEEPGAAEEEPGKTAAEPGGSSATESGKAAQ
jgi:N utilization substance protein A